MSAEDRTQSLDKRLFSRRRVLLLGAAAGATATLAALQASGVINLDSILASETIGSKYDEFFKEYNGKQVEVEDPGYVPGPGEADPPNLFQCMDLAFKWVDFIGIPRDTIRNAYAKDAFPDTSIGEQPSSETLKYFDVIGNDGNAKPQKGDVVVFGKAYGDGAGHIGIANGKVNGNQFEVFSQNTAGTDPGSKSQLNTFILDENVSGWLRPKNIFSASTQPTPSATLAPTPTQIDISNGIPPDIQAPTNYSGEYFAQQAPFFKISYPAGWYSPPIDTGQDYFSPETNLLDIADQVVIARGGISPMMTQQDFVQQFYADDGSQIHITKDYGSENSEDIGNGILGYHLDQDVLMQFVGQSPFPMHREIFLFLKDNCGWTVGYYAKPQNQQIMSEAFQQMMKTFEIQ